MFNTNIKTGPFRKHHKSIIVFIVIESVISDMCTNIQSQKVIRKTMPICSVHCVRQSTEM